MTNSSNTNINTITNNNNHRASNGTHQACAACKYQRRKCVPDCALAPYFPHDRQRQFLNAHKLFGVSNITKIIRNLSPYEKDIAMRTIMYQSDIRAKDPVGGCFRIIRELHLQIEYCKAELDIVLQQLGMYKEQTTQHVQFAQPIHVGPVGDVILTADMNNYQDQYQALMRCYYDEQQEYNNVQVQDGQHGLWGGAVEESVLGSSNGSTNNNNNVNNHEYMMIKGDHLVKEQQMMNNIDEVCASDYNDDTDFGSKFDDPRIDVSCSTDIHRSDGINSFNPQQPTELSEELLLKEDHKVILVHEEDDSFYHHIPEHDLRSAATLFTLN